MKIAIVSDIHANYDALQAFPEDYDELWIAGDLVNYGPEPREVLAHVRHRASVVVRGNHDHAVGHDDDTRWSARYRAIAEATRRFTASVLSPDEKSYVGNLPLLADIERNGVRFHVTHATPSDPLHGRLAADSPGWLAELAAIDADVLIVGHTHQQFIRKEGGRIILNPGSLGQPRGGDGARAQYAIWQDGNFHLREFVYPVEHTISKIKNIRYPPEIEAQLLRFLQEGGRQPR